MKDQVRFRRSVSAVTLACVAVVVMSGAPVQAVASATVALYRMDEPAGSTVLADSSGNGRDGTIGSEIPAGTQEGSTTFQRFPKIAPDSTEVHPEHLDNVADDPSLDPGTGDFSVTVRYRTTNSFGNIIQKGQNATPGGYFKFEAPNGVVTCLFKGANGDQRSANSVTPLNDGRWHIVKCERTSTAVSMYVDGVLTKRLVGSTDTIDNDRPLSIGGKSYCDQIKVTCDYFGGDIDYVRIEKGSGGTSNAAPVPTFTSSCDGLTCTFDASGSYDPDGEIHAYNWNFGDGAKDLGATVAHTYPASGTYTVKLTVVDDAGGIGTTSGTVAVTGPTTSISFVSRALTTGNMISFRVQVPTSVRAGDGLILLFSENTKATVTLAGGVKGWAALDTTSGGKAITEVWRKVALADDPGKYVRVDLSQQSKGTLTLLAYRGTSTVDPVAAYAKDAPTTSTASRTTPTADVTGSSSWAISYWVHMDSTTTALTVPASTTSRAAGTQSGGGRITTLSADSNGVVPSGTYGGKTSNAAAASTTGSTWTIVLAPG